MATLDVFKDSAFDLSSLSAAINKLPFKPKLTRTLGLFTSVYEYTDDVWVEEQNGTLSLLRQAARGTVRNIRSAAGRKARNFKIPHVPQFQTILASDIANKRAFGTESELEVVAKYVNDQLQGMKDNHDVTHEYHRIGAIKGTILDGDGSSTIYNLFTEFGLTQIEEDFDYNVGNFSYIVTAIIRHIAGSLGDTSFGQIYALCGDNYFDAVKQHESVKTAYERWRTGEYLRMSALGPEYYSLASNGFEFNNVMFLNYRGQIGNVNFIPANEAYYIPTGIPGLFTEIYGPANFMETVNTRALPFYAKRERMKFDMGEELHTQSNMLAMCTRPTSVIKSTVSNFSGTGTS